MTHTINFQNGYMNFLSLTTFRWESKFSCF